MRASFILWAAALGAAVAGGCPAEVPLPAQADLGAALVARTGAVPPGLPAGACWEAGVTPAVIETVTGQVQARPGRRGPDGTLLPAASRSETRPRIVSERREVWFETLCPGELTPERVAVLQRALKARGLWQGPPTGIADAATATAVRAWQRPRGLDSGVPARAMAEALGVVPARR